MALAGPGQRQQVAEAGRYFLGCEQRQVIFGRQWDRNLHALRLAEVCQDRKLPTAGKPRNGTCAWRRLPS